MTASPLAHDVRIARAIVEEILAAGVDQDDPDLTALAESECDAVERLRRILRYSRHVEAQAKALAEMQSEMRDRKARLDAKAEALRSAVRWAMSEIGLKRIEAPDLTASLSAGRAPLVIADEAAVPDDLCRVTRAPDKTAIRAALDAGREVPGATWGNPSPTLTVRVK